MSTSTRSNNDPRAWYDIHTGQQVDSPTDGLYRSMLELRKQFDGMKKEIETLQSSYTELLGKYDALVAEKDRE